MDEQKIDFILPLEETIIQSIVAGIVSQSLFAIEQQTPSDEGIDYKTLYYGLFRGITSIARNTTTYEQTIAALNQLQSVAEDAYIEQGI